MWFNTAMLTLIPLLVAACGSAPESAPPAAVNPAVPAPGEAATPRLACPPGTEQDSGSSEEGVRYWCAKDGVFHGPFEGYHPDGEKSVSGAYFENEADGSWIWWHENGATMQKGKYNKGKQTGSWTWWHANGQRKEEGDYLNGRRQGQWITYYETGLKQSEGMYQNNMKTGAWLFFNDDSENSVEVTRFYENDEVIKERPGRR